MPVHLDDRVEAVAGDETSRTDQPALLGTLLTDTRNHYAARS